MAFKSRMAYFVVFIAGIMLVFSSEDQTYLSPCLKGCDDRHMSCLKDAKDVLGKIKCPIKFTTCKDNCKKEEYIQPKVKNLKQSFKQQLHKRMASIWRKNVAT